MYENLIFRLKKQVIAFSILKFEFILKFFYSGMFPSSYVISLIEV